MMLIPLMREDLFKKIEFYGLVLGITKPIIPSILFDGILEIFKKNGSDSSLSITDSSQNGEKRAKQNHHILVVEDNKTNQFIAKTILEQVGITVILANNGEEGASYYIQHIKEIDLILMDLHMPVLNGYEATLRIRLHDSEIPIVAMTADAITGIEEQCKRAGIDYYISKPFEPDKFIDTILEILNQHPCKSLENTLTQNKLSTDSAERVLSLIKQEDALKLLGNNLQFYHKVLKNFSLENISTCDTLEFEIQKQDYLEAAGIVHKVKGSSGNIGANELYRVSILFQKALENNQIEDIATLHTQFKYLLKQSLTEIDEILKNG